MMPASLNPAKSAIDGSFSVINASMALAAHT